MYNEDKTPLESDEWRKAHPIKKDTRKWCKGKEGREHVIETVLSKWPYRTSECGYSLDIYPWYRNPTTPFMRKIAAKNRWVCFHQIQCVNCKKILNDRLTKDECPIG